MLAIVEITPWHYAGFIILILFFLALDLGVFHRHAHVVSVKEACAWTALWFSMAVGFAILMYFMQGREDALEFATGYLIELSLSMDNVFVIALIFGYFKVPDEYQHRVLFWGILGALVMRGIMIGLGAALVHRFEWILYIFGAFLLFTGIKMFFSKEEGVHPERNPLVHYAEKTFPVTRQYHGTKFLVRLNGKLALTPLALVLVMVETTDLVFAVDSIPAIFAITKKPFIVFTSNVFAILGLRSLYFALAGAIRYFQFLKYGLSLVLVYIGAKMLIEWWDIHIESSVSLVVVAVIIGVSMLLSVLMARHQGTPAEDSSSTGSSGT